MTETPSIRNGLQRCENLRNSLGLNYKSVALSELPGCKRGGICARAEPTL